MSDNNRLQDGMSMFQQGRYVEAIPLLKEQLAKDPNDIQARSALAVSYSKIGNMVDAVQEYINLTELQPDNAQYFYDLGAIYDITGNPGKAKEYYEKALAIDPGYIQAQRDLAVLQSRFNAWSAPNAQMVCPASASSKKSNDFNWGAFLLPFFWSIAHNAWIWVLVSFFVPMVASIVLLIKGNEIAKENRQFASEEEFVAVQKAWTLWGIILFAVQMIMQMMIVFIIWLAMAGLLFGSAVAIPYFMDNPKSHIQSIFKVVPGSGNISEVSPYSDSVQTGTSSGTDSSGYFTSHSYKTSADFNTVNNYFKGIASGSGAYTSNSYLNKANYTMPTKKGIVQVNIQSENGETTYTIKTYKPPIPPAVKPSGVK
ncbi:MAG: tetratricopeptide repeat protein [Armatimonadota bacterium]